LENNPDVSFAALLNQALMLLSPSRTPTAAAISTAVAALIAVAGALKGHSPLGSEPSGAFSHRVRPRDRPAKSAGNIGGLW
jgi:hypothetical protein